MCPYLKCPVLTGFNVTQIPSTLSHKEGKPVKARSHNLYKDLNIEKSHSIHHRNFLFN